MALTPWRIPKNNNQAEIILIPDPALNGSL